MGTIAEKLTYLNETKTAIKNAIIAKGVSVTDNDSFRSYADKIESIEGGGGGGGTSTVSPTGLIKGTYYNIEDFDLTTLGFTHISSNLSLSNLRTAIISAGIQCSSLYSLTGPEYDYFYILNPFDTDNPDKITLNFIHDTDSSLPVQGYQMMIQTSFTSATTAPSTIGAVVRDRYYNTTPEYWVKKTDDNINLIFKDNEGFYVLFNMGKGTEQITLTEYSYCTVSHPGVNSYYMDIYSSLGVENYQFDTLTYTDKHNSSEINNYIFIANSATSAHYFMIDNIYTGQSCKEPNGTTVYAYIFVDEKNENAYYVQKDGTESSASFGDLVFKIK